MTKQEIEKMYKDQLDLQTGKITESYQNAQADLDAAKRENQRKTDENLVRTAVEAQKDMRADAEYAAATGLTSGAREQARISRSNQTLANMTALRAAQQEADAQLERDRATLARQFEAAILEAQTQNDMAKAQALYEQAAAQEKALQAEYDKKLQTAKFLAEQTGDYSQLYAMLGIEEEEQPAPPAGAPGGDVNLSGIWDAAQKFFTGLFQPKDLQEQNKPATGETQMVRNVIGSFGEPGDEMSLQQIEANIMQLYEAGRLTEEEVAALIEHYDLAG